LSIAATLAVIASLVWAYVVLAIGRAVVSMAPLLFGMKLSSWQFYIEFFCNRIWTNLTTPFSSSMKLSANGYFIDAIFLSWPAIAITCLSLSMVALGSLLKIGGTHLQSVLENAAFIALRMLAFLAQKKINIPISVLAYLWLIFCMLLALLFSLVGA
jgi:hypothetical protein